MKRVEIRTERLHNYRFAVRVFVDGRLSEEHIASVGRVTKVRNQACDAWSSHPDVKEVAAAEIPWHEAK